MADPYARLHSTELYRNRWLSVEAHEIVHPNGRPGEHLLVVTPKASAVVVEDGGDLVFSHQPRFGARSWVIEIVKGGQEAGESALHCARRELREELGLTARTWSELGVLYEIPSIVSEPVAIFLARDVEASSQALEGVESIEAVRLPLSRAFSAATGGEISDAVTVAALFRYFVFRGTLRAEFR
jgi:8-oxo-dGTP pyrophosphatase MutT (NUDIX family)